MEGRFNQLWGKLGERAAELLFNLKLCRSYVEGHDARLGNDLVEIKTITPGKRRPVVRVKRSGNFSMLAIVRVYPDYRIEARLLPRSCLPAGRGGRFIRVNWNTAGVFATDIGSYS